MLTTAAEADKALPSTPEMKSTAWTTASNTDSLITRKVVGMARSLQETSKPPTSIDKLFTKRFRSGQTYDPFDFSPAKLGIENVWNKNKRNPAKNYNKGSNDPFERVGIDPLDVYTMPEILSRFLTSTGQIMSREMTGCNERNQKKLAMAIKRARTCGLLSSVHRHSRYMPSRIL